MQMLKLKTRKLFYKKWPFKIECRLKNSSNLSRIKKKELEYWLDGEPGFSWIHLKADRQSLKEFAVKYMTFMDEDIQVRGEGSHFNIFLKDKDLMKKIIKAMGPWIMRITEPANDEELEFLMNNSSKNVICDELPWGKYQYKVYLRTSMKPETRSKFTEWINRYDDRFLISRTTERWLLNVSTYVQDPFFYVQDSSTLAMAGLYLGNDVKRTEEFIIRSNINTSCQV